ncbi:MoxR family ATPase [Senegalimassilia faecalis]|uniref:MoxR family ATPase n=1 Tax=Senegalimassilia faecalis TaxID=2509433 RepID=A0A4Q2K2U5_9ACTN|nr:MoxR family ATPase [Senegalimassilia faecalis]RXZ54660.1 MoxR family ATPase [Senegalimassilia faecalis]
MIVEQSKAIVAEVNKALIGKQEVVEQALMAIYAGGHILLEDVPGTGKTTLALALSKCLDLDYKRVQFTPDTMPSDITGFTMLNRKTGEFEFNWGAVNCNLLLGDEINRTSAKTQSALLEVMEELAVTVDGVSHPVPKPFICIATENPVGSAGTQPLPDSQIDRFMVRLSIGYPSTADQVNILKAKRYANPLDDIKAKISRDNLLEIQNFLGNVQVADTVLDYIVRLCEQTRDMELVELGVSPRGVIALTRMARACALIRERDFVSPEDVREVFKATCAHRLALKPQARIESVTAEDILDQVMEIVPAPSMGQVVGRAAR